MMIAGDQRPLGEQGLGRLRNAEIDDFRNRITVGSNHHDIGWLEVPVDDAPPVRVGDRITNLAEEAKTGLTRQGFLDAEVERYRAQLDAYASAVAAIDPRPIRVGLYFPLMSEFRDWVPETESGH